MGRKELGRPSRLCTVRGWQRPHPEADLAEERLTLLLSCSVKFVYRKFCKTEG